MKSFSDSNVKSSKDLKGLVDNNNSSNNVGTGNSGCAVLSKDDLDGFSLRDLIHLEDHFHGYLRRVRAKKEELLLEQIWDVKEQVMKAPRSTNGNSGTVEKSMDSGLSEISGSQNSETQGDSEHCCPHEALLSDALRADISEQTEQTNQDLPAANKRFKTSK